MPCRKKLPFYGKAGGCIVTGNEDGVKHCSMGILYILQHLGYSIPPQDAGWIGKVGPGPSYGDREWDREKVEPPVGFDSDFTIRNTTFMTYNLLHLAKMINTTEVIRLMGIQEKTVMRERDGISKILFYPDFFINLFIS